jgi:hypothetical protein
MKRFFTSLSIALGLAMFYTGVAYAQGGTTEPAPTGEIAAKLAGLVAAATLVERILEMIWDFIENNILTGARAIGNLRAYVEWTQGEIDRARSVLIQNQDEAKRSSLEEGLRNAEKRLSEYIKSDAYVTYKKKLTVVWSIPLGLLVAAFGQLRMISMLGLVDTSSNPLFSWFDVILTGLIIATGSAPVHSLIGILQKTKDTVDAARALYSGKAIAEVREMVELLKQEGLEASTQGLRGEVTQREMKGIELERVARRMVDL